MIAQRGEFVERRDSDFFESVCPCRWDITVVNVERLVVMRAKIVSGIRFLAGNRACVDVISAHQSLGLEPGEAVAPFGFRARTVEADIPVEVAGKHPGLR